jgi:N-dimethylarginine dimethylaminohydrolase
LKQLLDARGFDIVEVPHDEWLTMGPNVLALGPRRALALAGNPVTKERMEAAGVEVLTYEGRHISLNGDGGPTCLTRPLMRG